MRRCFPALLLALGLAAGTLPLHAAIGVSLTADPASPAPVGTRITFTPQLDGLKSTDLWYRFRVRETGGAFRVVRDFGPTAALDWTSLDEGSYDVEVSVRELRTGEVLTAQTTVELTSRVTDVPAAAAPTSNVLVYLYSARCEGGQARVRFTKEGGAAQHTPYRQCSAHGTVNFYLAGLTPETPYSATLEPGGSDTTVTFTTGPVTWSQALPHPLAAAPRGREGVLLEAALFLPPFASDLDGNLLWYGPSDISYLTNPVPGGTFWALTASQTDPAQDRVREFDLTGMTLRETNAARVSEQLVAQGRHPITGFHHEARPLPDGRVVVLGAEERLLTNVQGPGTVDVLGDVILVLDSDLQVVWSWDSFDHLDPARPAVLGETCALFAGCPVHYLAADANDWTHGNAVSRTADGNLLFSVRHQDWVVKIDYADGAGSGRILWRLGPEGDFRYESDDPYPWFSHQHDVHPASDGSSTILLFDNGNTRIARGLGTTSRGQAIELDETNRVARLRLNADLHLSSGALGAAQMLADGQYQFDAGLVPNTGGPGFSASSLQVDSAGNVVATHTVPYPVYRSFRLESLYGTVELRRRSAAGP